MIEKISWRYDGKTNQYVVTYEGVGDIYYASSPRDKCMFIAELKVRLLEICPTKVIQVRGDEISKDIPPKGVCWDASNFSIGDIISCVGMYWRIMPTGGPGLRLEMVLPDKVNDEFAPVK